MADNPLLHPYKTAFEPDLHLNLPLYHLLGNKIGIHVENGSRLLVSAWKPTKPNSTLTGRIYISPLESGSELLLVEDYMEAADKPKDFPIIFERTTQPEFVNTSLMYVKSKEIWNFKIHMRPRADIIDPGLEMIRRETLTRDGSCVMYHFVG